MSVCKTIMSVFVTTAFFCSTAAADTFPHGCEVRGFAFSQNHLIINDNGSQAFYLIQNRGTTPVELEHFETRDVFMSPPLNAKLDPSNWAAFASDVQNTHFQCFTKQNDATVSIDCRDVLEVCQYPRAKFALSNMGNYWVSTNKPQYDVITEAARKGIYLRW